MIIHHLKCWPNYFQAVKSGDKKFELRLNDRNFQVGDFIILNEWDFINQEYTGEVTEELEIKYLLKLKEYSDIKGWIWKICRMLMPNLVILSIEHSEN